MAKRGRGARSVDSLEAAVWRISSNGCLNIVSEGPVVALMRQGQANEARCEMHASISTDNCLTVVSVVVEKVDVKRSGGG